MLSACSSGDAQTADTEISADNITVSETETSSDSVTVSETETVPETTSAVICTTEPVHGTYSDYRDAYRAKLIEMREDEYGAHTAFDLFDMDSDGIPELFASYADIHFAGACIFTFKDGELLPLSCADENDPSEETNIFGSWGQVNASSDGYISSELCGQGTSMTTFFRFDGRNVEKIADTEHGRGWGAGEYFMLNGEDVSEEEFNAVFDECSAHDWVTLGRGNNADDETIEKVIYGE